MFSCTFGILFGTLLTIAIIPHAASYTKYGRTCKDIGCRSDETCVMAEDPCTGYTDKCGRYPTCRKTSDASCTTMMCGDNEYCKSENGAPKCVRKSTGIALPPGLNQVPYRSTPRVPSPPPRSSSYGGRYSGYSGSRNTVGDGSIFNRLFGNDRRPQPTSRSTVQTGGNGYYNTHTHVDSHGNRVWTFSAEDDELEARTVPKRQSSYPTEAETHGSSDTSKNSGGQPAGSSGYPSSSGYPGNGYPSSRSSDSTQANQPSRSGYPSSGSSGYPSSGSSGYPSSGSSGYPSSGSSGYPSSGSSGYPSSGSSGYPSSGSSGYPSSGSSGYPPSGSSGYPTSGSSGYPTSGSSRYPSSASSNNPTNGQSGYPSSASSMYPSSGTSGYPSGGSSGYPTGSGYPANSRNPYGEETVRRTGVNAVNAGYPNTSGYPGGNPSYPGNYPAPNTGYPSSGYPYNNQRPPQPNQGYPQNYPRGGNYQGQNYMTTTKRPGIREQLTNFARNVAERVLTQTIVDRVTGRH